MNIISLLGAFGLGSIVTTFVQAWLARRAQVSGCNFEERKAAYIGLLEAYHRAAVENTDEASKNFAYWQMRCELVAPQETRDAIEKIVETNEDRVARDAAHINLKKSLRRDLGIASPY